MKKYNIYIAFIFILSSVIANAEDNIKWEIDRDHSKLQFKAVYMGINDVYGQFNEYEGTITTEDQGFDGAEVNIVIYTNSIDTDNEKRDKHLKNDRNFLYIEQYPEIRFHSTSMKKTGEKKYKMVGELTIKGKTKTEEFNVKYNGLVENQDKTKAAFVVSGKINRFDYNVDWNRSFSEGLVVSQEIDIMCTILLVKQ
ncbi:MAG: YceI family protein [Bacteroidota bacterium]